MVVGVGPALAGSVWWGLTSGSWPSSLQVGACGGTGKAVCGKLVVSAENRGYVEADGGGTPVVVRDLLPAGLKVLESKGVPAIEAVAGEAPNRGGNRGPVVCSLPAAREVACEFAGQLPPAEEIEVRIAVEALEGASSLEVNTVSVSGGGAGKTLTRSLSVGEEPGFGIESYEVLPEEEGGRLSSQAGVHPFQLTNVLALNTSEVAADADDQEPAAMPKNMKFALPPGLIGNPTVIAQCTDKEFNSVNAEKDGDQCAPQTAVGTVSVTTNQGALLDTNTVPLFNLVPLGGEPARFGFEIAGAHVVFDVSVTSGGNYGVVIDISNVTESVGFLTGKVTFWGVPGDPRHNRLRGWACIEGKPSCAAADETEPPPFLSLPTSCTGPMQTTVQVDSWDEPKPEEPFQAQLFSKYMIGGLDGCNHLPFDPSISVAPDVPDASSATGLTVQVHVPQTAVLNPEGLAESTLRDTTVALPVGVAVNPGGADGLAACSEGEVGYLGSEPGEADTSLFTSTLETPGTPFCPNGAKIATAEIETPLLSHTVKGAVYLASQDQNPFGSLIALYIIAEDPVSGFLAKFAGEVALNQETGQLVSTFKNTPQLPFENLRLHFFGESRAPLGTPPQCGTYTTQGSFVPWSGNAVSEASSTFNITSGPNGELCASPLPFAPSLTGGTTSIQAGGFTPFTMTMSREDADQNLKAITLHMPPGLSGTLTGVTLCPEAQANTGTCGPGSLIGETTVSVGLGGNPYTITSGKVYFTGPYEGAPFGLSIVVPTSAGPFTLQGNAGLNKEVVRAKIEVDPHTAALTITSDSSGPYAIPPMIDGIPLHIKHVNVTVNRSGFTFNPTNCNPQQIRGTLTSTEGAMASLTVPFQVTNCATLKFAPIFSASTTGNTSRSKGAGLTVKLVYPKTPQGTAANVAEVKVELPKRLPSRLSTLQKACTAKVFERNPADCPAASIVGHARATTPIIPVALEGPAYFVSHGGEAFPSLVVVLQGYGVTVELVGTTFISKRGITSSSFKTIPDVPVGTFELTLPQGSYSALAATGSLCKDKDKLTMPTEFTAQNGQEIHQITKIAVTHCPKAKNPHDRARRKQARHHKKGVQKRKS
jgi:hypothetical protein